MKRLLLPLLLPFLVTLWLPPAALAAGKEATLDDLQNPGYHDKPDWFKSSFLDIREDVADAADADRRVILYFYQDGCPYCSKLLQDNFGDREITATTKEHFDVIAINMWGDREVTGTGGELTTEKQFAADLGVQYTPTMLLLDEDAQVVLRIDGYFPPHQFHEGLRYVALKREREGEPFRDFYLRQNPKAASGELHSEGGFLQAPLRLADNRAESERPLVVMFEQPVCSACDELHEDILERETVSYALSNFDGAIVNAWSDDPVQTPDGRETTVKEWANDLGIEYTPSLVFFDTDGKEVFRTEAYLKGFHVHGALDYVATGAYRHEPSFQRFLQARTGALQARGIEIDMMQ